MVEQYIDKAMVWLESGAMWVQGQLPLYIEELIKWQMARNTVFVCVYAPLLLIGLAIVVRSAIKGIKDRDDDMFFITFLGLLIGGFSGLGVVHHALRLIQVSVAPRVYLIEYFTDLL